MAEKTPIRYAYDGSSLTGIAEYATSDTVGVAFGGTGATSLTDNAVLIGNTTSAIQATSALTTNGQIVIGGTSGPAVANISGTSNEVEITNGDGTITIGLPSTLCSTGTLEIGGNVNFDGGGFVFNDSGADKDFRIEGDSEVNLFITDASVDRIGIGTATPSHLVDIEGVAHAATCFVAPDVCATTKVVSPALCIGSQYVLPTADGSAGQIMCTDGSGALAFATASGGSPGGSDTYVQFNDSSSFGGSANLTWDDTTLATTAFTATGNVSLNGGTFVFNESGADKDFRIEGDTEANLFFADASTDRIGIGTASPASTFEVASTDQKAAEIWSTNANPYLVIAAEAETQNDTAGIAFNATKNQAIGGANTMAHIYAKVTNSGGNPLYGNLYFNTTNAETDSTKMLITAAGVVSTTGDMGIGTTVPDGTLHVFEGSGGTITANANADTLVVETDGNGGISILSPAANTTAVYFGDPDANNQGQIMFAHSTNTMSFTADADTSRNLVLASGGNVGIGTTTPDNILDIESSSTAGTKFEITNTSTGGNRWQMFATGSATGGGAGNLGFYNITDAVWGPVFDQYGQVGIGTTAPDGSFHVFHSSAGSITAPSLGNIGIFEKNTDGGISIMTPDISYSQIIFGAPSNKCFFRIAGGYNVDDPRVDFSVTTTAGVGNSTITMRPGKVGIGTVAPGYPLHVYANSTTWTTEFGQLNATPHGVTIYWPGGNPDDNTKIFFNAQSSGGQKAVIYSDGDMKNHDGVYGTLSDARFKQDIEDARSYWDDFKQLQYRKWRDIVDVEINPDAPYRLGLVAQEVEPIFPALVAESLDDPMNDDDDTTHKWVRSSIIDGPIMATVVQELQTRLEAAEAEIAILKG